MWRILVFLLVFSPGAFANPAIEVLKAGFEEALNKVKVLQAEILAKHVEIQQKQADLEATIQTVENLKLRLDGVESDVNENVKKVEQRANQHTNTKTAQVDSKANAAQNTADDARNRANKAQKTANTAISKANAAQNTANKALIRTMAYATGKAKLDINGTTKTQKLQLGEKWLLSGDGDTAGYNDDWLRLMGITGTNYHGGFAAGRLWTREGSVQSSDVKLKLEIETLDNTLDKLLSLRGVSFKWKNSEQKSHQIGVIAQEIEKVFPEIVEMGPDNMKGVNYSGLIPILIEAIKEQQQQIEELKGIKP